jgi:hypothetical protein
MGKLRDLVQSDTLVDNLVMGAHGDAVDGGGMVKG